ncbi:MAG: hypothetical protein R3D68_16645 [Hyphomicrobiaceae bacterium]
MTQQAGDDTAQPTTIRAGGDVRNADARRVLILGASYGSLLASKLLIAGHHVHLVCRTQTAELFRRNGSLVRMPVKGREGLVEIDSRLFPGTLTASTPAEADPSAYDLVVLAMQEPQYGQPGVRELMARVAAARVPVMSIMNMPPLPYLKRIPGLDADAVRTCYTAPEIWDAFDPDLMTLCSPDPQAFRPPAEPANVLQVRLATNFKSAGFADPRHTEMLRRLDADIETARVDVGGKAIELPVKLKVHDSVFVPLAKWAMLLAGNYRCIGADGMRPIRDAVHGDLAQSQSVYGWVTDLCVSLGADPADLVPFEKYANAATSLASPSSAARALDGGSVAIERIDRLVQAIAASKGLHHPVVDETVARVEQWLARNRAVAEAA